MCENQDKANICNECNLWYHINCVGISPTLLLIWYLVWRTMQHPNNTHVHIIEWQTVNITHRLIPGPVHPSFGLVKCTVGRVYLSSSASWTGIPRPRCTEYDRASTIFRPVIVPVRRAISHRMLRCRRVSLAKPCYDQSYDVPLWSIGRGTGSLWNAALRYNKETAAYYYRWLDYSGDHYSFTNNQWKQSLDLRTSINSYNGIRNTNRLGIYCTIAINAATFAIFSLRGIPISWHDFGRWAFLQATFLQRILRRQWFRGLCMVYYLSGRCSWAAS